MVLPKIYDWARVRSALKLLAEEFPDEFKTWILIGGGACWFYRESSFEYHEHRSLNHWTKHHLPGYTE